MLFRSEFQRYFVERQSAPRVQRFNYEGATTATPSSAFTDAISTPLDAIVICPSNPFISIDPMLAIPGFKAALQDTGAPVVALSPIVGGEAIKGPAAKMLDELGLPVSALGIAHHYGELLDGFVVDERDQALAKELAPLPTAWVDSMMHDDGDKTQVARAVLRLAQELVPGGING